MGVWNSLGAFKIWSYRRRYRCLFIVVVVVVVVIVIELAARCLESVLPSVIRRRVRTNILTPLSVDLFSNGWFCLCIVCQRGHFFSNGYIVCPLYDKGWMRVLQSVGYPSQNKSHFA